MGVGAWVLICSVTGILLCDGGLHHYSTSLLQFHPHSGDTGFIMDSVKKLCVRCEEDYIRQVLSSPMVQILFAVIILMLIAACFGRKTLLRIKKALFVKLLEPYYDMGECTSSYTLNEVKFL